MIERKDNNKPNIKSDKRSFTKADRQAGNAKGIRSGGALSRVLRKAGQAIGLIEDDETKAASIQRSDGRVLDLKENIVEGMGIGEHQGKLTELVYEGVDVSDESKMNELVYEAIEAAETDSTVSKITFVETAEFAEGFAKSKAELIVESFSERFDLVEDFTPTYKPAIRESFQEDVQVQETFIVNALLAIRENFIEYMSIAEGFLQRVPGYIQESFIEAVQVKETFLKTNILAVREFFTERVSVAESFSSRLAAWIEESFVEAIEIRDSFTKIKLEVIYEKFTEAATIAESFTRSFLPTIYETFIESLGLTDSFSQSTEIYLPDPPQNLTVQNIVIGGCNMRLEWEHPADGEPDSYEILRSVGGSGHSVYATIAGSNTSYNDDVSGGSNGIVYSYQMRSVVNGRKSASTNPESATKNC